jgi:hypothetical protein
LNPEGFNFLCCGDSGLFIADKSRNRPSEKLEEGCEEKVRPSFATMPNFQLFKKEEYFEVKYLASLLL